MGLTRVQVGVGWVFTKMGLGRVRVASPLRRRRLVLRLQGLQLQHFFGRHSRRLAAAIDPYLTVTIAEYDGARMRLSDAYKEAQAYLQRATREARGGVRHLKAEPDRDPDRLVLSMGDSEEVADEFRDATV